MFLTVMAVCDLTDVMTVCNVSDFVMAVYDLTDVMSMYNVSVFFMAVYNLTDVMAMYTVSWTSWPCAMFLSLSWQCTTVYTL